MKAMIGVVALCVGVFGCSSTTIIEPSPPAQDAGTQNDSMTNFVDSGSDAGMVLNDASLDTNTADIITNDTVDTGLIDTATNDVVISCVQRTSGTFVEDFVFRSGNCGNQTEGVFNLSGPEPTSIPAPCTGTISYSSDNCIVSLDETCPFPGGGIGDTVEERGSIHWSVNGSLATGIIQLIVNNSSGVNVCTGSYDISISEFTGGIDGGTDAINDVGNQSDTFVSDACSYTCPMGTMVDGGMIDGTCGQVICGTDHVNWRCDPTGWTSIGGSCGIIDAGICPANLPPSCQSGTFDTNGCGPPYVCAGTYYGPNGCGHCNQCGGGLIEGPGDGTDSCYCLPAGVGAPNSGCPLDGKIHYYVNNTWQ